MPKKQTHSSDLRVIKTKRAIYSAFNELLKEKELDKITVTELAQRAEINKGTFYLHYPDVYALFEEALQEHMRTLADQYMTYDSMVSDPEKFADELLDRLVMLFKEIKNDPFFHYKNGPRIRNSVGYFVEAFSDRALSASGLKATEENRMKLMYLFAGIGSLTHSDPSENRKLKTKIIADSISALFPNGK